MADIDMIPHHYRDTLRVRRALRRFALAGAALVALGLGCAAAAHWRLAQNQRSLTRLQQDATSALSVSARLDALRLRHTALERNASALAALRAPGASGVLGAMLQQVLTDEAWLSALEYTRAEQLVVAEGGALAPDQYLQYPEAYGQGVAQTWQVRRRVQLSGAAARYAALSALLTGVSAQPMLREVRLVDSGAGAPAPGGEAPVDAGAEVSFRISAQLLATPGKAP